MKFSTFYNLLWITIFLMLALVSVCGLLSDNCNPLHLVFFVAGCAFAWKLFNDNECGESVREYLARKFKISEK